MHGAGRYSTLGKTGTLGWNGALGGAARLVSEPPAPSDVAVAM
jgi:hypothetical protein